jgi:hypothetical protein
MSAPRAHLLADAPGFSTSVEHRVWIVQRCYEQPEKSSPLGVTVTPTVARSRPLPARLVAFIRVYLQL